MNTSDTVSAGYPLGAAPWAVLSSKATASCKLGSKGLEKIIEIKLMPEEQAALDKSAAAVKELVGVIGV